MLPDGGKTDMPLRSLVRTESLVLAVLDSVLFGVFTGAEVQKAHVEEGIGALLEEARKIGKAGMLVAHATTPLPKDDVRDAVQRNMARLDPYLCCGATVIAKEGFAGSAIRAVVSTLQILSRPTHPERTFANPEEAASFLVDQMARHHKNPPSASVIVATYEELTSRAWKQPSLLR